MREADDRQADRLAELRRRAPRRTPHAGAVAAVTADLLVMRVEVKREDAVLVASVPVQQVAVRGPLAIREAHYRERDPDHRVRCSPGMVGPPSNTLRTTRSGRVTRRVSGYSASHCADLAHCAALLDGVQYAEGTLDPTYPTR